jgi:hypothetical protein
VKKNNQDGERQLEALQQLFVTHAKITELGGQSFRHVVGRHAVASQHGREHPVRIFQ